MNANVTVIKDEALGGIEREYVEVKRKAAVGERIKIVAAEDTFDMYENGDLFVVDREHDLGVEVDAVCTNEDGNDSGFITDDEYVVLEPVESVKQTAEPAVEDAALLVLSRKINEQATKLDAQATQIDGLTDAVAKLTRRLNELYPEYVKVASGPVSDALPSFAGRDDVIAKAKRDVAELALNDEYNAFRRRESGKEGPFYLYDSVYGTYTEFIVNSDKRTVVCLLRGYVGHDVLARGIAKCAPGDVFNSHIGRAIALRRALGLSVPTEYTNAPAPREPRVGDIITFPLDDVDGWYGKVTYEVNSLNDGANLTIVSSVLDVEDVGIVAYGGDLRKGIGNLVFYDDSREEVTQ